MITAVVSIWILPTLTVALLGLFPLLCLMTRGRTRSAFAKVTITYYVLILISVGFIFIFKKQILQGEMLTGLSHRLFATFAPSDLNTPLYKREIEIDNNLYEFTFQNKYPGFYKLELHFSGTVPQALVADELRTKEEIQVSLRIEEGAKVLLEKNTPIHTLSFWGRDISGMGIYFYKAPSELNFDQIYKAQIRISGDLKELVSKYGPVYLVLQRDSDKFGPTFEMPLFNL